MAIQHRAVAAASHMKCYLNLCLVFGVYTHTHLSRDTTTIDLIKCLFCDLTKFI